jgi:formylglycine-generating enzyme required for sulfatase activity
VAEPIAGELVDVPGGAFLAGSRPGLPGRIPRLEPRTYRVELGPFRIDRLPFPNDPKKPFLTGVTREQAKRHCATRGARLCTELEWERACKGPESDRYASGEAWQPRCAKAPNECASGFDALAMGAALREWVQSDVIPPKGGSGPRLAVVRGAAAAEPASAHRCARRRAEEPETEAADIGFRCCQGAPNAAVVEEPTVLEAFEKTRLPAKRLEKLLADHPRTKRLAKEVTYYREPDSANTVIARGHGDTKGFDFTVLPIWNRPVAGAEYLDDAARSGKSLS